jgi:hypothetical protein
MPTQQTALSTLTADSDKGRKATDLFRHAYNNVGLNDERGQVLNENKAFPAALRELIERCSVPVQAPTGGRIYIVHVPVDPGRKWGDAIDDAGPDTGRSWDVRKVGDHYPPQEGAERDEEIILVNFGKTIPNTQYALDWAEPFGLVPKAPRAVFAVAKNKPTLHRELGVSGMAIISPVSCTFGGDRQVCYSWLNDDERDCRLRWYVNDWSGHYWFAFGRE